MNNKKSFLTFTTVAFAALYFLCLSYLQAKGIIFVLGCMGGLVALYYSFKYPELVLAFTIAVLGLCPFFFSVRVFPGLPKVYAEDLLFFYFTAYMLIFYGLLRKKRFRIGNLSLWILFFIYIVAASIPFLTEPVAKTALRNLTETALIGFFFYIVFLNETNEANIDKIIAYIAVISLCVSFVLCIETIAQANPVMKAAERLVDDFVYLAPSYYKYLGSYYRPYAVFFHPSEAGTFVAMGMPFVFYTVRGKSPFVKYGALALNTAGIILNFTRGVWVALALTLVVCNFRQIKRFLPAAIAAGILALGLFSLSLSNTGFGKRFFDPSNLTNRLYYWKIGFNMFTAYFPFGIGHMNFKTRYLEFVDTEPAPPGLEVEQIFVADNLFLTTLVEHGMIGFTTQLLFFISSVIITQRLSRKYRRLGDTDNAFRLNLIMQSMLIYLLAGFFADVQLFAKVTKLYFILLGMAMAIPGFTTRESQTWQARPVGPAGPAQPPYGPSVAVTAR